MICCTVFAALLALLYRPLAGMRRNPLAWRPGGGVVEDGRVMAAHSRLASFGHAFRGIAFVARRERNMQIHIAVTIAVIGAGLWFRIDVAEWRWLAMAIVMVLTAEMFNTAIEQACNAVTAEFNAAIKAAKDVAAGAVLTSALFAAGVGASVFLPYVTSEIAFLSELICRHPT